jgi:hypothetical protein
VIGQYSEYPGAAGSIVKFKVANVRTPRSSRYTSNFHIDTLDENGYLIDTSFSYQMPPVVASRKTTTEALYLENDVVGELSKMRFEF